MAYLDFQKLDAIEADSFQQTQPYPWINPMGLITDTGYERLTATLPTIDQMNPMFGIQRSHGQKAHDRYALEYHEGLDIGRPWHDFAADLMGDRYQAFIRRLFGRGRFKFSLHWHYAPRGASVSPHCDSTRKLGSHIFYFSNPDNWNADWGGDTLILDDGGRFSRKSAPAFEDFEQAYAGESMGNYSLLFQRQERSWHGVREITCPEGHCRKVFIVVINDRLLATLHQVKTLLKSKGAHDY